ncbi:hypothetical protein B5F10_02755 [Anaerotruncus colihominis]|uniref:Uncharacterized protein n=1 Tax=Anaerotruncus colihominis TaxID=169435 RepID=A0A1Y4MPD3_9FIRM|nr:hypothetical protein [Anaerotruncus colihominis]OUP70585.1 hypothetical protein B5F11_03865 [Anaerotruncus colihominis]OUP76079.1 hypothetical protein B5F10_02755 [Anaerotruncus colihominis]
MRILLWLMSSIVLSFIFGQAVQMLRGGERKIHWRMPIFSYFMHKYTEPRVFEGELAGFSLGYLLVIPGFTWIALVVMILFGICTVLDCAYRCIIPIIVLAMFGASLFTHGLGMIFITVLVDALMFAIYSIIYAIQLSRGTATKTAFEVRGFGLADMFLLCTMVNTTSVAVLGSSMIFAGIVHTPCKLLAAHYGVWDYESKSFAFYPFTMMGLAIVLFLQTALV